MGNAGFVIATGNALVPSFVGLVLGRIEHVLPCAAFVNPQDLSPFAPFQTHKFRKMAIFLPIYCPKFVKFSKFDEISNLMKFAEWPDRIKNCAIFWQDMTRVTRLSLTIFTT